MAEPLAEGHAFISYVREDADRVDDLQRDLRAAGVRVWRDTQDLWPGQDWRLEIRRAIQSGSLVFLACFSENAAARETSYQREELLIAIDEVRKRPLGQTWLIPIRFSDCEIPPYDLGGQRTLNSLHGVDLFGAHRDSQMDRLTAVVRKVLAERSSAKRPQGAPVMPETEPAASRQGISELIAHRLAVRRAEDRAAFEAVRGVPSQLVVAKALQRASALEIISSVGVRVPMDPMSLYVHLSPADTVGGPLTLEIQDWDLDVITSASWRVDTDLVDVMHHLGERLQGTSFWLGDGGYDPGAVFERLADLLKRGYEAIVNGSQAHLNRIFQVVEDDWFVLEDAIVHLKPTYEIPYIRFDEDDWDRHMRGKTWVRIENFRQAYDVGTILIRRGLVEGRLSR